MADSEEVQLLREIRDLLRPIAHHHRGEYEEWLAEQRRKFLADVTSAVEATAARRKAWGLADGTRTQREISKQANLDEGGTSKFFKQLRAMGAIEGDMPKRTVEV